MMKKPTTTGADRAEARFRKMLEDGVKRCGPIPALVASRQSARCFARKQAKQAFRKLVAAKAAAQLEAMRRARGLKRDRTGLYEHEKMQRVTIVPAS
mgnify:FL=1